jgi:hypothetical protein
LDFPTGPSIILVASAVYLLSNAVKMLFRSGKYSS